MVTAVNETGSGPFKRYGLLFTENRSNKIEQTVLGVENRSRGIYKGEVTNLRSSICKYNG